MPVVYRLETSDGGGIYQWDTRSWYDGEYPNRSHPMPREDAGLVRNGWFDFIGNWGRRISFGFASKVRWTLELMWKEQGGLNQHPD